MMNISELYKTVLELKEEFSKNTTETQEQGLKEIRDWFIPIIAQTEAIKPQTLEYNSIIHNILDTIDKDGQIKIEDVETSLNVLRELDTDLNLSGELSFYEILGVNTLKLTRIIYNLVKDDKRLPKQYIKTLKKIVKRYCEKV